MRNVIKTILVWGIILPCIIGSWGCKGGKIPELGDISGPATVDEYGYVEYSISFVNATGATFLWSCDPSDAGRFDRPGSLKTGFTASMVTQDTPVKISVVVESLQFEPVMLFKGITIKDTGWARTWGGWYWDDSNGIAIDGSGNAYITGNVFGTVDFDPGPGVDEHIPVYECDIFLSKFDSNGEFQWARTWGNFDRTSGGGQDVATDASGNSYITGQFHGTVDFDPGPGVDEHTSDAYHDVFLSKYDTNGDFQWACTWGGYGSGLEVTIDRTGNVYATGYFLDIADFDPGPDVEEHTSNGWRDIFLCKFNSDGEYQWTRTWGGSIGNDEGLAVSVDGSGNPYITGYFQGSIDFDPGPDTDVHSSNGARDIFLCKFDSAGAFHWALTWGGIDNDFASDVAIDEEGNLLINGDFKDTVDFDPGPGVDEHTSNGDRDIFLCKLDSSGGYQWNRTWGSDIVSYSYCYIPETGRGVAVDRDGSAYVTGSFSGVVDFDPGPGVIELPANAIWDIFLSKFDSSGNLLWVRKWGWNGERDAGNAVAIDGNGNAYVTGYFEDTVDFDPGLGVDEHVSNGGVDIFLIKFHPDGTW